MAQRLSDIDQQLEAEMRRSQFADRPGGHDLTATEPDPGAALDVGPALP